VLIAYVAGFLIFPPRVLVIADEERYVSQALAFSKGALTVAGAEILYPPTTEHVINNAPPGTSLLQTPFVLVAGWRAAAIVSVISLIFATLITARWLREANRHQAFALCVPGYFGALFFGRVAMSDVPSAALVALSLLLLWRSAPSRRGLSFGAGLSGGLTLLFREPNAVLLAPLYLDAIIAKRASASSLILGGATGIAVRLVASQLMFSNALYVRDSGYGFSFTSLAHSAVPFGLLLLVVFPAGAVLPFAYRGARATALRTAVLLYFAVFLLYEYDSIRENGWAKGLVLASRFVVPALPLLAFMSAEVWPRWFSARNTSSIAAKAPQVVALAMVVMAFLVHPAARTQETVPASIVRESHELTSPDVPIVTNNKATLKYLSPAYGPRRLILRSSADSTHIREFQHSSGRLAVLLLDRNDSEMFREDAAQNDAFLARVARQCSVQNRRDVTYGGWARLRVLELTNCA